MKFNCPFCGVELSAPDVVPGDLGDCPNCGREFTVPGSQKRKLVVHSGGGGYSGVKAHVGIGAASDVNGGQYAASGFGASLFVCLLFLPVGAIAVAFSALSDGAKDAGMKDRCRMYASAASLARIAALVCFFVWLVAIILISQV